MADETPAAPQAAADAAPTLNLIGQYIRDLSFENPNAPGSILAGQGQPTFNVSISVNVKPVSPEVQAVELTLNAKAERDKTVLFNVELIYGGVFRIRNVPDAQMPVVLMIECPRLLFPFARHILANVTQQGGFPPLTLDPVNFEAIYRQNMQALAAQQAANKGQGGPVN